MEWVKEAFTLSDDKGRLDFNAVCGLMKTSYWAAERPSDAIAESIAGSLCFGLYYGGAQIGFARVVTDKAVFSWLCDVIIAEEYRGQGLGKWMVGCILEHRDVRHTRFHLATRDAHGLHERFGFQRFECMGRRSAVVPE